MSLFDYKALVNNYNFQAGMFPVVSRRWKVSLKKRTVWDNLDSDSDYEPSGEKEEEEEEVGEGEGVGQEEKVN